MSRKEKKMTGAYPFGAEFKLKILAILVRDKSFIVKHRSVIKPTYFENSMHVLLSKTIFQFFDKYGVVPTEANLREEISKRNESELLTVLLDKILTVDMRDADHVEEEAINFATQQAWKLESKKADILVKEGKYDEAKQAMERAFSVGEEFADSGFRFSESFERIKAMLSADVQAERRLPTLIRGMDRILRGGILPCSLHMIFAPTKRGKSILLNNFATAGILMGKKVLYISLELDDEEMALRSHMRISGMSDDFLLGKEKKWRHAFRRALSRGGDIYYRRFPTKGLSVSGLATYMEHLWKVENYSVDLLIVDYLDLMSSEQKFENSWQAQGYIAEHLRGLGVERNVAIWTATQGSKASGEKEQLSELDVKGDSIKADTCDSLFSLLQNEGEAGAKPPRGRIKCNLLRSGSGMGEIIPVIFDKTKMLVTDWRE